MHVKGGWLRQIVKSVFQAAKRREFLAPRRIRLEQLESRCVLAAIVASDDLYAVQWESPANTIELDVVANDERDDLENDSLLRVTQVNGFDVNVAVGVAFPVPTLEAGGTLILRADHRHFDYTPAPSFTGVETFSYFAGDGVDSSPTAADATLNVQATANAGGNADSDSGTIEPGSYAIYEGGEDLYTLAGLHLDGSLSAGPGPLEYYWYIDGDLMAGDPSSPTLDPTWADLGITNGQFDPAIVTLKIVDANDKEWFSSVPLDIVHSMPEFTSFTVEPVGGGGACGGETVEYVMTATFTDKNPLDAFTATMHWDFGVEAGVPLPPESITNNLDGTFTISATLHSYDTGGTYAPVLFIESVGESAAGFLGTFTLTVPDGGTPSAPDVSIAGPGSSEEGSEVTFTSEVVQNCATAESLNYHWVLTLDGDVVDEGFLSTYSYTPGDNGVYEVTLTVSDSGGAAVVDAELDVANVTPTITSLTASQLGGPEVTVSGTFTDPGTADSYVVEVTWESGEVSTVPVAAGVYSFSATYLYDSIGAKVVSVTITDDDGDGTSDTAETNVLAAQDASGVVNVVGLSGNDDVTISSPAAGIVRVESNFLGAPVDFVVSSASSLIVDLGDGNDTLLVSGGVTARAVVFGGAGNDIVTGGGGPTVLVGGSGNDGLAGGAGRNILIGGAGSDILYGASGQDILIDSGTQHDTDAEALLALLAEWNSSNTLQNRILNLTNGSGTQPGLNGTTYLTTNGNDLAVDLLIGGGSTDWITLHAGDLSLGLFDIINRL